MSLLVLILVTGVIFLIAEAVMLPNGFCRKYYGHSCSPV